MDHYATHQSTSVPLLGRFFAMIGLTILGEVLTMWFLDEWGSGLSEMAEAVVDASLLTLFVVPTGWLVVVRPLRHALGREHHRFLEKQAELEEQVARHHLDAQLNRALEMATSEPEVLDVVQRALRQVCPDRPVEVLLADASHAHLRRAVMAAPACELPAPGEPVKPSLACSGLGCPVASPAGCVAARRGQVMHFESSEALDTCPQLARHAGGPLSATCVPLSIGGRAVGVLHTYTEAGTRRDERLAANLYTISAQTGARLGMLRAMEASELAATTDPLSGLLNRRSLTERARLLENAGAAYSLVACDLDHFKRLNDTFGHAAGDQAIKTFARVLRSSCRPDDVLARAGGEEFVMLLAGVTAAQAESVAHRVRATLRDISGRIGVPEFTVSFGIAETLDGRGFEDLMRQADQALYNAKRAGRDCVRRATGEPAPAPAVLADEAAVIADSEAHVAANIRAAQRSAA